MPWELCVPPALAGDALDGAWWWKQRKDRDWTCLLDLEE
jgi:hypothetical protein